MSNHNVISKYITDDRDRATPLLVVMRREVAANGLEALVGSLAVRVTATPHPRCACLRRRILRRGSATVCRSRRRTVAACVALLSRLRQRIVVVLSGHTLLGAASRHIFSSKIAAGQDCHCTTKPHMRLEQSGLMAPRTMIYIYISISCQENIKITYPVEVMLLY